MAAIFAYTVVLLYKALTFRQKQTRPIFSAEPSREPLLGCLERMPRMVRISSGGCVERDADMPGGILGFDVDRQNIVQTSV